jgi:predicted PurR-regulated permease PerM
VLNEHVEAICLVRCLGDQNMTRNTPQPLARTALISTLVVLGIWTLHSFLPALIWAVIFAIAIWPLYERLEARFGHAGHNVLLPVLLTSAVALIFVVPLLLAILEAAREARDLLQWFRDAEASGIPAPDWLTQVPLVGDQVRQWWLENLSHPITPSDLRAGLHRGSTLLVSRELGAQVAHRTILFAFTLLALFFLLRDGRSLTREMLTVSQGLFGPRGERIAVHVVASVHGTLIGLVLVGLGEGLVLGIAYRLAGVPHPVLLGVLTGVAAIIPFGAPIVFVVAALLLLAQGAVASAVCVLAFGCFVLAVADHVVRPVLIGGATKLPFLWVLLGILGGVETWGLLGLFLGPAIMASLMLLWRELVDWYRGSGQFTKPEPLPVAESRGPGQTEKRRTSAPS